VSASSEVPFHSTSLDGMGPAAGISSGRFPRWAHMSKRTPLERLGQPDDIANVISFLAGPNGGGVNSQGVRVNGGFANPFETQAGTTGRAPINTKEKLP
jgi:NAD(P)-dependent dehydrogenase (short-subunit alcohol dehydrogenase family)